MWESKKFGVVKMCKMLGIKEKIEYVRSRLDKAISDGAKSEDILAISEMLDSLIYQYYSRAAQNKKYENVYKGNE